MAVYQGILAREGRSRLSQGMRSSLFLGGYLTIYALEGLLIFMAVFISLRFGALLHEGQSVSVLLLAAVLFGAGVWQLTPFKERCLAKCVSPMGFFLTHSRTGNLGALRMGADSGAYCAACCWMYSIVMLVVAAMSLFSMFLLTGLIVVEKAFVGSRRWFKLFSSSVFFALAALVALFPYLLGM